MPSDAVVGPTHGLLCHQENHISPFHRANVDFEKDPFLVIKVKNIHVGEDNTILHA